MKNTIVWHKSSEYPENNELVLVTDGFSLDKGYHYGSTTESYWVTFGYSIGSVIAWTEFPELPSPSGEFIGETVADWDNESNSYKKIR